MSTMIQNTQADDLVVYYPMNETTGSVASAVNPAVTTGRDLLIYGDFSTDVFSKGTGWTVAGGIAHSDGTGTLSTVGYNIGANTIIQGKSYQFTYTILNYVSGSVRPILGTGIVGTTRSANGTYTDTITAGANGGFAMQTITTFVGDVDNVTIKQLNIAASTSYPGSELLTDGDMEAAGTSAWSQASGGILSKQGDAHGGTQSLRVAYGGSPSPGAYQAPMTVGRSYRVTGYARGDGVNSGYPRIYDNAVTLWTGTNSNSWQAFDVTFVATTSLLVMRYFGADGYAEFDDISVTEVNPMNGSTSGATINQTENSLLGKSYSFDGINDYVNIYSPELNSAFDPSAGTLLAWAKVANSGVWSDGTSDTVTNLYADANNYLQIAKSSTTGYLIFNYLAGGTVKSAQLGGQSSTNWMQVSMTWSKLADQLKGYLNGSQAGSTPNGLGTWTGNLTSATAVIAASNASGGFPWSGNISHVALWKTPLTAIEIANLNGVPAYRDTSKAYSGSASVRLEAISNSNFAQFVNVGDTNQYALSAYVYTDGTAVTSSDAELYANGSTVTTTYTDMGSGWYKLSGSVTGANESRTYGVQVKSGQTLYVDGVSVHSYGTSRTFTSEVFDAGVAPYWGNIDFTSTTPTNTTLTVKARSSKYANMTGATAFASCTGIATGSDITDSDCVTDLHNYIQYELTLATTDNSVTPTMSDISLAFTRANVEATLDSPGGDTYTGSDRPTFRWRAGSDANTTVSGYSLEIDNGDTGDFSITGIPVNRTTDYETSKYKAVYEGFGDSDTANNYISVYTKSSADWSSTENDGKLREGKRTWKVKADTTTGSQYIGERTLNADFTGPSTEVTSVNSSSFAENLLLADTTPTISGKVTDALMGDRADRLVASGPKNVEIRMEKKTSTGLYDLHSLATVNLTETIWNSTSKYSLFTFTPEALPLGTYRILITGRDDVNNSGNTLSFNLTISTLTAISTPEEEETIQKIIEEAPPEQQEEVIEKLEEITVKETTPAGPSIFEKLLTSISQTASTVYWAGADLVRNLVVSTVDLADLYVTGKYQYTYAQTQSNQLFLTFLGDQLENVSLGVGSAYNYVASMAPGVAGNMLMALGNGVASVENFLVGLVTSGSSLLANVRQTMFAWSLPARSRLAMSARDFMVNVERTYVVWFDKEPTRITLVKTTEVGDDYAVITWETNHYTTNNKVNYGEDMGYGSYAFAPDKEKVHTVRLTNLNPNTKYVFEVMSENSNYIYDSFHEFTTGDEEEDTPSEVRDEEVPEVQGVSIAKKPSYLGIAVLSVIGIWIILLFYKSLKFCFAH